MPPRAVDSARSQRRKTRYDLVPAGGSPHGARFSLVITKLPLWKIRSARPRGRFSLFSFPSSASLPIVVHLSRTPFSLGVIAKSATHYPILPPAGRLTSLSLAVSLSHTLRVQHPSSYSPRVFIPDRFVLPVATPRDRPRLAQVTAIGNFNARPILPNDFIQRNGCRGAARRGVASTIDAQTRGSTQRTRLPSRRRPSSCRLQATRCFCSPRLNLPTVGTVFLQLHRIYSWKFISKTWLHKSK